MSIMISENTNKLNELLSVIENLEDLPGVSFPTSTITIMQTHDGGCLSYNSAIGSIYYIDSNLLDNGITAISSDIITGHEDHKYTVPSNSIYAIIFNQFPMATAEWQITSIDMSNREYLLREESYAGGYFYICTGGDCRFHVVTYVICCFSAGTQILVDFDGTTKPIEEIKPGDFVVSYNLETQTNYLTEVKSVYTLKETYDIAEVTFDNGTSLKMNAYHPLYSQSGWKSLTGYKGYEILAVGDLIKTVDGWTKVIDINRYKSEDPIKTYTLNVRDLNEDPDIDTNDNFYANGIVAKNASCPT